MEKQAAVETSENMVKVYSEINVSFKQSVEVCKAIKGKTLIQARKYLQNVLDEKDVVKYTRFNKDVPHRKGSGVAAGRRPMKAVSNFINLLNSLEKNAMDKGLTTSDLKISLASANRGYSMRSSAKYRRGRLSKIHLEASV